MSAEDRGERQPEGDRERNRDPPPASSPIFLVKKPTEVTLFPFRPGNSLGGRSLHWLYDSSLSLSYIQPLGKAGRAIKGNGPNATHGGKWLVEKTGGSAHPHERHCWCKVTTDVCTTLHPLKATQAGYVSIFLGSILYI